MAEDRANDPKQVINLTNVRDGEDDFIGFGPVLKGIVKQQPAKKDDKNA